MRKTSYILRLCISNTTGFLQKEIGRRVWRVKEFLVILFFESKRMCGPERPDRKIADKTG